MPLLFPKLRITQVFGANTDVGKTLLTTALLRSTAAMYEASEYVAGEKKKVFYLKPVSTGSADEADDSYVKRNIGLGRYSWAGKIDTKCLYQYREPVSPHLAARLAPELEFPATNEHLLKALSDHARACAAQSAGSLWIETAGGVHSPALHPPFTQADALRPLRLPTLLIAAPHLGGISTTLASYESLLLRGYTVDGVMCLRDPYYRNEDFLEPYFADRGIGFWTFQKPPARVQSREEDGRALDRYYTRLDKGEGEDVGMRHVAGVLERMHGERVEELEGMPRRTLDSVWWPFTQHGLVNKEENVMVVDSAKGDYFDAFYKKPKTGGEEKAEESLLNPLFDGSASWFTQAHTHANPELTLAAAEAAGRYGHVLFPSGTHAPALNLAERVLQTLGRGWASRVFFSDNGSTGMEVALKMALRATGRRYGWQGVDGHEVGVVGLKGGYHGDTIGSMDASDQSIFNTAVDWYRGRGHWFSPPAVSIQNGQVVVSSVEADSWPAHPMKDGAHATEDTEAARDHWSVEFASLANVYDVQSRLGSDLAQYYTRHIRQTLEKVTAETDPVTGRKRQFGALVLEPICLGAGGMVFVDPLFQRCLMDVVRDSGDLFGSKAELDVEEGAWRGLPVVFDEVFSGIHRLSYLTASSVLGSTPDIATYAKILTGGLLPLSLTLASNSIFQAFYHPERKVDALLHGHSYTANPIGCNVALKALQLIDRKAEETNGNWVDAKQEWSVQSVSEGGPGQLWSLWSKQFIEDVSRSSRVKSTMAMGTVLAIELQEPANAQYSGYASSLAQDLLNVLRTDPSALITADASAKGDKPFEDFHIHSRPLGNVLYMMTSLYTDTAVVRSIEDKLREKLASGW